MRPSAVVLLAGTLPSSNLADVKNFQSHTLRRSFRRRWDNYAAYTPLGTHGSGDYCSTHNFLAVSQRAPSVDCLTLLRRREIESSLRSAFALTTRPGKISLSCTGRDTPASRHAPTMGDHAGPNSHAPDIVIGAEPRVNGDGSRGVKMERSSSDSSKAALPAETSSPMDEDTKSASKSAGASPPDAESAPKPLRKSSKPSISRPPVLFDHLPDATQEAVRGFAVLSDCVYASKALGNSDQETLDCDCEEEYRMRFAQPPPPPCPFPCRLESGPRKPPRTKLD